MRGRVCFCLPVRIPSWLFAGLRQGAPQPPGRTSPLPPPKKWGWELEGVDGHAGLALKGHPMVLSPGPAVWGLKHRSQQPCPGGQQPEDWRILVLVQSDSCTTRCACGICCICRPVQLERKSLRVSAPSLTTEFLCGVWSADPAVTCRCRTLRIQ